MPGQRPPQPVFRQLPLALPEADDQIVPRELRGWRRGRVVPLPEITTPATKAKDGPSKAEEEGRGQKSKTRR